MFTKLAVSTVCLAQTLSLVSASQLRGAVPQVEPPILVEHRRALAEEGSLTVNNNCGQDISHFKANYKHDGANTWTQQVAIDAGKSYIINGVDANSMLHFFGFNAKYDYNTRQWVTTGVAYADNRSNYWTEVTFNEQYQFPFYMKEIGDDWSLNLCTETVEPTSPPPPVSKTLRLHNNCGKDINQFQAKYNVNRADGQSETYEGSDNVPIEAGQTVTIPNVHEGTKVHFYGLNGYWDSSLQQYVVTEVASAPEQSNFITRVTFNGMPFDYYMKDIGKEWYVELCSTTDDNNAPTTTAATPSATTTTTKATTTTTATATATTTTTPTTTTTTTTTPTTTSKPAASDSTLTIHNNCGSDITHFKAKYYEKNSSSGGFKSLGDMHLADGESTTVDNVAEGYIHYYGLDLDFRNSAYIEVASSEKESNRWSTVTVMYTHSFPFYMKMVGADMTLNLCD